MHILNPFRGNIIHPQANCKNSTMLLKKKSMVGLKRDGIVSSIDVLGCQDFWQIYTQDTDMGEKARKRAEEGGMGGGGPLQAGHPPTKYLLYTTHTKKPAVREPKYFVRESEIYCLCSILCVFFVKRCREC
jgi:hypothetical protein